MLEIVSQFLHMPLTFSRIFWETEARPQMRGQGVIVDVFHEFVEVHASRRASHTKDVPGTLCFLLEHHIELFECGGPVQKGNEQLHHLLLYLKAPLIKSLICHDRRSISEILLLRDTPRFYQVW